MSTATEDTTEVEAKPEAPPEPPAYKMPKCWTGLIVIHRPSSEGPNTRGVPMIITKVGSETVNGSRIMDGSFNVQPIDGVRHISDPQKLHPHFEQFGTWDYTPETKLLMKLASEMGLDVQKELSK